MSFKIRFFSQEKGKKKEEDKWHEFGTSRSPLGT
jgi:hypothetical protein